MPPLLIGNYGAVTAAAVRRWLLEHRPHVIIGCTCEALALLSRAKIRVPEDAAFAAFQILRPGRDIAGLDHRPGDRYFKTSLPH